jgi:hypothetical protein
MMLLDGPLDSIAEEWEGSPCADELQEIQYQIDTLDLDFLEDIQLADGHFIWEYDGGKEKSSEYDSDDDSTVEMTASVSSSVDSSDEISAQRINESAQTELRPRVEIEINTVPVVRKLIRRGSSGFGVGLSQSLKCSMKAFNIRETDLTKERIKMAALRAKIRQQKLRNEHLTRELKESQEQELDLTLELHQTSQSIHQMEKIINTTSQEHLKAFIETVRMQKNDIESKRRDLAKEKAELHARHGSNVKRIEKLRSERNDQASKLLQLELLTVRKGIERQSDSTALRTMEELIVQEKRLEVETKIVNKLSDDMQKLQTDKRELDGLIGDLRAELARLKETKVKQEENIIALEINFAVLNEQELYVLEKKAQKMFSGPDHVRPTGRFRKLFQRRRR